VGEDLADSRNPLDLLSLGRNGLLEPKYLRPLLESALAPEYLNQQRLLSASPSAPTWESLPDELLELKGALIPFPQTPFL
jgi:hypothetical protein